MGKFVKLNTSDLKELRKVDPRLVSYNVEMTEVTGGTFWSAYTQAQVEGTEEVSMTLDLNDLGSLQQYYEPVDLYNERLRKLARELGTAWVRVSGTWANKTYYDFDGHLNLSISFISIALKVSLSTIADIIYGLLSLPVDKST